MIAVGQKSKMLLGLLLIAAALLLILEIVQLVWRISISRRLVARAVAYQRINPQAQFHILVVGDSTGVGTGAKQKEDSIAGRLGQTYADAQIINVSKNGVRVHDALSMLKDIGQERFDLIVIQVGGNDILRFGNLKKLRKDLSELFKIAKSMSPRVVALHSGNVGLAPFFPRPIGWIYSWRTQEVRAVYGQLAREHGVHYVDLYQERKTDPFGRDPRRYYAADMLHPSSDGYAIWYEHVLETIEK